MHTVCTKKQQCYEKRGIQTVPQLSWLERYTDNVEVRSSNLRGTTTIYGFGVAQRGLMNLASNKAEGVKDKSLS